MSSVGKLFLYFMVHKMCRELAGRSSSFYKTPADTVIGSCLVKLNDRKTYFRVNDDITEVFSASCYQEKLSGKSRNLNTDGGPFSGGVQSWADSFPLLLLSDDSLSSAVSFMPPLLISIVCHFDKALYEFRFKNFHNIFPPCLNVV